MDDFIKALNEYQDEGFINIQPMPHSDKCTIDAYAGYNKQEVVIHQVICRFVYIVNGKVKTIGDIDPWDDPIGFCCKLKHFKHVIGAFNMLQGEEDFFIQAEKNGYSGRVNEALYLVIRGNHLLLRENSKDSMFS